GRAPSGPTTAISSPSRVCSAGPSTCTTAGRPITRAGEELARTGPSCPWGGLPICEGTFVRLGYSRPFVELAGPRRAHGATSDRAGAATGGSAQGTSPARTQRRAARDGRGLREHDRRGR